MSYQEWLGKPLPPRTYEVDRSKIRELATALGDTNPIYHDVEAAKRAGYQDLALPPTFATLFSFWGRALDGSPDLDIGLALEKALHGEEEYTYLAPIYPGDIISGVRTLVDVQEKKGKSGTMQIATFETLYRNQQGHEVLKARTVAIIRL